MRCARAQALMTAAVDGELTPRRRGALDRHLAGCEGCRRELATTARVLTALETLSMEAAVPEALEHATLRRVRVAAAEESLRPATARWRIWLSLPAFAVATAAVVVLAFGIMRLTGDAPAGPGMSHPKAAPQHAAPPGPIARLPGRIPPPKAPPAEPPPELAAAPDKFMNLPILKNLEKLEHFEAIQTTTLDDETPSGGETPSNG
jgi:hypothetical protein